LPIAYRPYPYAYICIPDLQVLAKLKGILPYAWVEISGPVPVRWACAPLAPLTHIHWILLLINSYCIYSVNLIIRYIKLWFGIINAYGLWATDYASVKETQAMIKNLKELSK